MILCDKSIRKLALEAGMLTPFSESVNKGISYGLTSSGYDLRLAGEFKVFKNTHCQRVDPKNQDPEVLGKMFDDVLVLEGGVLLIPPLGYVLGRSLEWIEMPVNLKGITIGKSTYARCGILVNVTPAEPGWRGHLTIEISNLNSNVAVIYPGEGIAQMEFHVLDEIPEETYADKGGKYQDQQGVTPAKVI